MVNAEHYTCIIDYRGGRRMIVYCECCLGTRKVWFVCDCCEGCDICEDDEG